MIQALVKKGKVKAEQVPSPSVSDGCVLIRVTNSCISAGTEISGVVSSGKTIYQRIKEQPEKVAKMLNKIKVEGFDKVYKQMKGLLEGGQPTGYSVSGIVLGVGKGVDEFNPGDRVAAAGGGLAMHAEFVDVPKNLVVKVPDSLSLAEASSVTLGAIAMHGVRRAGLQMGEFAVVTGTGILGLLTVQMLYHAGLRVIAIDLDKQRLELAEQMGAELTIDPNYEDAVKKVEIYTYGKGCDAVLFTAATSSSNPLADAFKMCRRKGKVVLVGVSGMEINRNDIYAKELDLQISTSYGPGRYDKSYEIDGIDYPYPYVRWTEKRNLEEYLRLLNIKAIGLEKIINRIYPINEVSEAFESLKNSVEKPLMIVLDYGLPEDITQINKKQTYRLPNQLKKGKINIAIVGAGSFVSSMHLPNLSKLNDKYNIYSIVDKTGYKAKNAGKQYHAQYVTTDYLEVLNDEKTDLVFITTPHEDHARMTLEALKKGKHVFVEKPLAIHPDELNEIIKFQSENEKPPLLMVGYNRRFSPAALEIKKHTYKRVTPLLINYRMNADYMAPDHWVFSQGGRIIGEACHIIDLMTFFINAEIEEVVSEELSFNTPYYSSSDNKSIVLKYKDGSVAHIQYFSTGSNKLSKEHMEIHFENKSIIMDDYKSLKGYGLKIKEFSSKISDKGHMEEIKILYDHLTGKKSGAPIEYWDLFQTSQIALSI